MTIYIYNYIYYAHAISLHLYHHDMKKVDRFHFRIAVRRFFSESLTIATG